MARCAASHRSGPLVALGLDRVEQWNRPGWAGAALCNVGLVCCSGGAPGAHFPPGLVAPGQ